MNAAMDAADAVASFPALVLAGHGTRDPAGQAVIAELVARVRALVPGIDVVAAHLDHQRPGIGEALAALVAGGTTRAAVVPLLLSAATHSKTDVASAVARARAELPRLSVSYGRPLGPHPALLNAVEDRLAEAGVDPDDPGTAVVLASAGASDPDANGDIAKTARLLWEGHDWAAVEPAFASATKPSVTEVIGRLRRLGIPRVVVVPYFLAPGRLTSRVIGQAYHAGGDMVTAVVGAHPAVASLVVDRYREALRNEVLMNCDTCVHRAPLRGRPVAVGAPFAAPSVTPFVTEREAVG
ncbi:MAG: sirohydrochlorin chelatase [Frankiaceae bacterium]